MSLYSTILYFFLSFFFFQAEDGIRDGHVTGVQTCALPISDEKYKETIQHVTHAYKSEMKKGLSYLQKLKDYQPFKSMQELEINDEPDLFDDIIKEIIKLT